MRVKRRSWLAEGTTQRAMGMGSPSGGVVDGSGRELASGGVVGTSVRAMGGVCVGGVLRAVGGFPEGGAPIMP